MKKPLLHILFSLILFATLASCDKGCKRTAETSDTSVTTPTAALEISPDATPSPAAPATAAGPAGAIQGPDLTADTAGLSKATVVVKTAKGTVKFKFYPKEAPNTVKRFIELAQQKFFNGQTFHRVVPGFVAQTGDPKSRNKSDPSVGTGGSGQRLKAEFNARKHVRGAMAMARAADIDSADSQFYFTLGTFPHLDEKYTVFGQVVDYGEKVGDKDVLDRITQGDELVEVHVE